MNRRRATLSLLVLGATNVPLSVFAQDKKQRRVAIFMSATKQAGEPNVKAILDGLKEHGYETGRNLVVDTRYADGDPSRYPAIADELVALKPDLVIVSSTANTIVMKSKTATIPIVMGSVGDPVGDGIVKSLARPGGNVTGNSLQLVELGGKQIELLTEMLPRVRRVTLLVDLTQPESQRSRYEQSANAIAKRKGLMLQILRIGSGEEVGKAFEAMKMHQAEALLIGAGPRFNALRSEICRRATGSKLPLIGFSADWPQDGALMSFSASWPEAYRRTAYFADRIFKGAKPEDLPIEQPRKFELVVNAKVAKTLGLPIPPSILVRADQVIE